MLFAVPEHQKLDGFLKQLLPRKVKENDDRYDRKPRAINKRGFEPGPEVGPVLVPQALDQLGSRDRDQALVGKAGHAREQAGAEKNREAAGFEPI
jgi:hypothetical protein